MKTITDVEDMSPNMLVSWFMMASYAYYVIGGSGQVMDDMTFDRLVQRLKEKYGDADHPHKKHITEEHLSAGTGFDIDYPTIVKHAYYDYIRNRGET